MHPWRKVAPMAGVGNSDFSFTLLSLLIPPLGFTINPVLVSRINLKSACEGTVNKRHWPLS